MRLVHPSISFPLAERFDEDQRRAYSKLNNVSLTPAAEERIALPIRAGRHGFNPVAQMVYAAYAASLIEAEPTRAAADKNKNPHRLKYYRNCAKFPFRAFAMNTEPYITFQDGDNHALAPERLAQLPEHPHKILLGAWAQAATHRFWKEQAWEDRPNPANHSAAEVRRRVRYHSLLTKGATAFLTAHPSIATRCTSHSGLSCSGAT